MLRVSGSKRKCGEFGEGVHQREDMDASNLTTEQRTLIEDTLALVSAVHEEAGAKQTLQTYLKLGEATRNLERLLGIRDLEQ